MNIIQADPTKNLMLLKLEGLLSDDFTRNASVEALFETKKLKAGYTVIEDRNRMEVESDKCKEWVNKILDTVYGMGVGRVIRIVGGESTNSQIPSGKFEVSEVHSMGEAIRML